MTDQHTPVRGLTADASLKLTVLYRAGAGRVAPATREHRWTD